MDAILAQVEPSLLRTHSFNAFQQELKAATAALAHAVTAAARLRDVSDASRKLSIDWTPAEPGSLSTQLVESRRLLAALGQSIRHVQAPLATPRAVVKAEHQPTAASASRKTHAIQLSSGSDRGSDHESDSDSDRPIRPAAVGHAHRAQSDSETDDDEWPTAAGASLDSSSPMPACSKKRKLEASAGDESTKKSLHQTQKSVVKDAATVAKELLALCSRRAEDLLTRRVKDRRAGLKALVTQFNQFHKHLSAVPSAMEVEASDILSKVVSTAVNVMTKEGMEFKRHWVRQFQSAVGDVRAVFDAFACQIEP